MILDESELEKLYERSLLKKKYKFNALEFIYLHRHTEGFSKKEIGYELNLKKSSLSLYQNRIVEKLSANTFPHAIYLYTKHILKSDKKLKSN